MLKMTKAKLWYALRDHADPDRHFLHYASRRLRLAVWVRHRRGDLRGASRPPCGFGRSGARALSLIAPLALSVTTKQASNSSTDQGGGKRRWEGIELDQCSAKWALQFSLSLKEDADNDQVDGVIERV